MIQVKDHMTCVDSLNSFPRHLHARFHIYTIPYLSVPHTLVFILAYSSKLNLYASLDQRVDVHLVVLRERDHDLVDVQKNLVQESGTFLGGRQRLEN